MGRFESPPEARSFQQSRLGFTRPTSNWNGFVDIYDYLDSTTLLSCTGSVTHELTLLPNGQVEIKMSTVTAVVEPSTRTVVRPRGFQVPDQVMDHAATLARTGLR